MRRDWVLLMVCFALGASGCGGGGDGGPPAEGASGGEGGAPPIGSGGALPDGSGGALPDGSGGALPDGSGGALPSGGAGGGIEPPDCEVGTPTVGYIDEDGDGYDAGEEGFCLEDELPDHLGETTLGEDCDDTRASVNPEATEVPGNLIDEDCDGSVSDADGDGEEGLDSGGTDCDDLDGRVATEVTAYVDQDGDGYGAEEVTLCVPSSGLLPARHSSEGGDCDDADPAAHPGLPEIPDDGVDNDCSGGDVTLEDLENVLYVNPNVTGPGTGTASDPFADLEATITSAPDGSVIILAESPNNYVASPYINGKQLTLVGGYTPGTPWTRTGSAGDTVLRPAVYYANVELRNGADLTLVNLTLKGWEGHDTETSFSTTVESIDSRLTLIDGVIDGPRIGREGGDIVSPSIYFHGGKLDVLRSTIEGGWATAHDAARSASASGINSNNGAEVRIVEGVIGGGRATGREYGSAIAVALGYVQGTSSVAGKLWVYDSTIGDAMAFKSTGGQDSEVGARGIHTSGADVVVDGTTIDGVEATVYVFDEGNHTRVMGMNIEGGNAQITDTTVLTVKADNPGGRARAWGIALGSSSSAHLARNRVEQVHVHRSTCWDFACVTLSGGVGVWGTSQLILRDNFIGSGWINLDSNMDSVAEADALHVAGNPGELVASGNVFVGQGVTSQSSGEATVVGRGYHQITAWDAVLLGNTIVGSHTQGQGTSTATASAVTVESGKVFLGASALVAGEGDAVYGVERAGAGEIHVNECAFVSTDETDFDTPFRVDGEDLSRADAEGCAEWTEGCGSATGGNVQVAAHFVTALGAVPSRDYHLDGVGPLVDVARDPTETNFAELGLPSHLGLPWRDVDGDPRPLDAGYDIGADELSP